MRVLSSTLPRHAYCPCRLPCSGWSCAVSAYVLVNRIAQRHCTTQPTSAISSATTALSSSSSSSLLLLPACANKKSDAKASGSLLAEVLRRRGDIPVPEWVTHAKARWRTPDISPAHSRADVVHHCNNSSSNDGDDNVVGLMCGPGRSREEGEEGKAYVPLLLRPPVAPPQKEEAAAGQYAGHETVAEQGTTSEDRHAGPCTEAIHNNNNTSEDDAVQEVKYIERCITDPLEWLAQAPDAPLADPAMLQEHLPYASTGCSERSEQGTATRGNSSNNDRAMHASRRKTRQAHAYNEEEKEDKMGEDKLVFNVFTRRVAKAHSASIQALRVLGITVDDATRELRLSDEEALCALAAELRANRVSWPTSWAHGSIMFRRLERLMRFAELRTLPGAVRTLIAQLYSAWHRRRQTGLITVAHNAVIRSSSSSDDVIVRSSEEGEDQGGGGGGAEVEAGLTHAPQPRAIEPQQRWEMHDLNAEQRALVDFALQGYCTYIGGGAGSGKSVLLRVLRQQFLRRGLSVAMTATTGIASCQIGGCTLHHCFGINAHGDFTRRAELAAYDVIIIDEVSMLPRDLFESLEHHLRRANGVDLPFGGVQVILCGDFMQLGAIGGSSSNNSSTMILTSPVFRRHFAMVKLHTVVRQSENATYARQLQCLRRGQVPASLASTVAFLTTEQVLLDRWREERLRARQQAALAALDKTNAAPATTDVAEGGTSTSEACDADTNSSSSSTGEPSAKDELAMQDGGFVPGAVNLLPTNAQVEETNRRELARLPADAMTFAAQVLSPTLLGTWSATYILRITTRETTGKKEEDEEEAMKTTRTAAAALHKRVHAALKHFVNVYMLQRKAHYASPLDERHMVLYPLFRDALAFRLRVPEDFDEAATQELAQHLRQLEHYLGETGLPVRLCELIDSAEGLHTERDSLVLSAYAMHSPMSHGVTLKLGCRVMLRANLSSHLVNGSIGTVVGLRPLRSDLIPRYLLTSAAREEGVDLYADFLAHECGFPAAVVPEVLFDDGRREVIPPISYYVGGLANTHHYSLRILALPLTLAYAFTVHKVQGLTLVGRVHLELSRMWPCDHLLYVAMSRVRNPEQLSIAHFRRELVQVAAGCLLFDDSLPGVAAVRVLPSFVPATWVRDPRRRRRERRQRRLQREVAQHRARQAAQSERRARRGGLEQQIRRIQEQMLQRGK